MHPVPLRWADKSANGSQGARFETAQPLLSLTHRSPRKWTLTQTGLLMEAAHEVSG